MERSANAQIILKEAKGIFTLNRLTLSFILSKITALKKFSPLCFRFRFNHNRSSENYIISKGYLKYFFFFHRKLYHYHISQRKNKFRLTFIEYERENKASYAVMAIQFFCVFFLKKTTFLLSHFLITLIRFCYSVTCLQNNMFPCP